MNAIPEKSKCYSNEQTFTQQQPEVRIYFSSKSAATYVDRTPSAWLQDRNRNPKHPKYYKLGSRILYKREDLDAWVENTWQRVGSAA